jgi:hypothetical protein
MNAKSAAAGCNPALQRLSAATNALFAAIAPSKWTSFVRIAAASSSRAPDGKKSETPALAKMP